MTVLFVAIGTSRARSVCDTSAYLLERGVDVGLVTVEPGPWEQAGLDPRVRLYPLGEGEQRHPFARLGRLLRRVHKALDTKFYSKVYRLLRPYVMWRVARRSALRQIEWNGVQQLVIGDSHAIPIGWHLARRHPDLPVGFELDRAPLAAAESAAAPAVSVAVPAPRAAGTAPTTEPSGIDVIDA